jgi:hypothetical protein
MLLEIRKIETEQKTCRPLSIEGITGIIEVSSPSQVQRNRWFNQKNIEAILYNLHKK